MMTILRKMFAVRTTLAAMRHSPGPRSHQSTSLLPVGIQNYPVGWDGKPIPYWLYKLHGLGYVGGDTAQAHRYSSLARARDA